MDFEKVIEGRYSVRKYSRKPVEKEKLDKILNAALLAPTAKNLQPLKLIAASSEAGLARVDSCLGCHFGAPLMIVVAYNEAQQFIRQDGQPYGEVDATIVATHMVLEAQNLGLGSCFIGLFSKEALKAEFSELEGCTPILVLCFGYPAEDAVPSRMHEAHKELSELVSFF